MNSLKKGERVPLLNFVGSPGVPLLNFEGGPGVPILNFRGSWVPLLNFVGCRRIPRSRVPGSWFHFYTMPSQANSCTFQTELIIILKGKQKQQRL